MDYPQILLKTFFKLNVTTLILVMRQHFPQDILKQIGLQTISYMAPKIWNVVPKDMKQITTLNEFKAKIKV